MHISRLAILALLLAPSTSLANGLSTHTWITLRAIEHVPPGPLRDFVSRQEIRDAMVSGTIFPDGGYAVGDGYGERAHWEPFQHRYLAWILANQPQPWSAEAEQHVAFLLGMSSHGMADQVFDSLFMARAKVYDARSDWAMNSMDEATDVVFVSKVGAQRVPSRFLPTDALIASFAAEGHTVTRETLNMGQNLAGFAVALVGMLAQDRDGVRDYTAQFPWATGHMTDQNVPGNPEIEARIVAAYWQRIWERLRGGLAPGDWVIATLPASDSAEVSRDRSSLESRFTIVFARRLRRAKLSEKDFSITAADGKAVPLKVDLFYGDDSHVVHLIPEESYAADTDYTVTVNAGLETMEGAKLDAPLHFRFSTRVPAPVMEAPDAEDADASSCTCVTPRAPAHPPTALLAGALALAFAAVRRRR